MPHGTQWLCLIGRGNERCHQSTRLGERRFSLVFVSSQFASDLPRLLPLLSQRLQAEHWIGFVGGGVVGTDSAGRSQELEQTTALSITLLNLPGAQLKPFQLDTGSLPDLDGPVQNWQDWVSVDPADSRSLLLFIDPSCGAINDLISGLDYAIPTQQSSGGLPPPTTPVMDPCSSMVRSSTVPLE